MTNSIRRLDYVLLAGFVALVCLPWYRLEAGFFSLGWLSGFPLDQTSAPPLWKSGSMEMVARSTCPRLWLAAAAGSSTIRSGEAPSWWLAARSA